MQRRVRGRKPVMVGRSVGFSLLFGNDGARARRRKSGAEKEREREGGLKIFFWGNRMTQLLLHGCGAWLPRVLTYPSLALVRS